MARAIKFGRYGMAENPTGEIVTWEKGERLFLARVRGFYVKELPADMGATIMLQTRYFCGDEGPDVPARSVKLLEEDWAPDPGKEGLAS